MQKNIFQSFRQDTCIFIDGANLFYSEKTLKIKVDYKKLFQFLQQYPRIKEIRIYLAFNEAREKEQQFLEFLKNIGYTVIVKKLKIIKTKSGIEVKKGNLDIELALDAFELKDSFRTMVLFSGDSDFDILLKKLKQHSKRCVVASVRGHLSYELFQTAHTVLFLDKIKDKIKSEDKSSDQVTQNVSGEGF